jgi:hypothetical protein
VEPGALTRRRRRVAALAALVLLAAAAIAVARTGRTFGRSLGKGVQRLASGTVDARAPEGVRIKVEVLNATKIPGLARRATMHLRDRGFDVVETGTVRESRDSTLVLDRSSHAEWARLVARAMGGAASVARPDSSHYVDVTVLVGASWRPPAEPFRP